MFLNIIYIMSHKLGVSNANFTYRCKFFYLHIVNNSIRIMANVNLMAKKFHATLNNNLIESFIVADLICQYVHICDAHRDHVIVRHDTPTCRYTLI